MFFRYVSIAFIVAGAAFYFADIPLAGYVFFGLTAISGGSSIGLQWFNHRIMERHYEQLHANQTPAPQTNPALHMLAMNQNMQNDHLTLSIEEDNEAETESDLLSQTETSDDENLLLAFSAENHQASSEIRP